MLCNSLFTCVYVHGDLVPDVTICVSYCFVLESIFCTNTLGPGEALGLILEFIVSLRLSLIFVRTFYFTYTHMHTHIHTYT